MKEFVSKKREGGERDNLANWTICKFRASGRERKPRSARERGLKLRFPILQAVWDEDRRVWNMSLKIKEDLVYFQSHCTDL